MELLERHFEIALETPDVIKKLRELILGLAMKGKLVRQDPKDQPARELLKEIEPEKKQLISEGKIKAIETNLAITSEKWPFEIPQSWLWKGLPDVTYFQEGPGIMAKDFADDGIPLIRIAGMKGDFVTLDGCNYLNPELVNKKWHHYKLESDDIVLTSSASLGNVAKVDQRCVGCIIYTGLIRFKCFSAINDRYLIWFFRSPEFIRQINESKTGAAIQHFGPTHLKRMLLPLPPLPEQRRIVAKIDQLMSLCDKLEAERTERNNKRLKIHTSAINKLLSASDKPSFNSSWNFITRNFSELYSVPENVEELKKAILQLAVMGKLVKQDAKDQPAGELLKEVESVKKRLIEKDNLRTDANPIIEPKEYYLGKPIGWEYCRLGNLAKFIDYRGRTPKKVDAGIPLITAKNVRYGFINREPFEYITEQEYISWMTRGFPKKGDLLFTTEAPLGNIAIIDIDEKFALAQRVICFQLHVPATGPFLRALIMSSAFQTQLVEKATGMTATGIKSSKLKEIPIPLPPLPEQHRIVAKINALMSLCDTLEQNIKNSTDKQTAILNAVLSKL